MPTLTVETSTGTAPASARQVLLRTAAWLGQLEVGDDRWPVAEPLLDELLTAVAGQTDRSDPLVVKLRRFAHMLDHPEQHPPPALTGRVTDDLERLVTGQPAQVTC